MDRHTCKLCFRRFHNGRALGGHMRSHVMAASAAAFHSPLLSRQPQSPPLSLSLASTSSTEMGDDKPSAQQKPPPTPCVVREGTKKRFDDSPGFSSRGRAARGGESSVVQDGESDTESSSPRFAVVSRRRSKRARRRAPPPAVVVASDDPEQPAASSVSDAMPVEDVAMSLVMLSRDSWTRSSRSGRGDPASSEAVQRQNNDHDDDDDDGVRSFVGVGADDADHHEHEDDDVVARPPRGGRHHQCGVCRKVFRSYQALGGHRASIKKGKGGCVPVPVPVPPPAAPSSSKSHCRAENNGPAPAVHECPFCFRVFESGQALGGHKRAHMPSSAAGAGAPAPPTTPSPRTPAAKCGDSSGSFDLNVPAAATDDDFELSAVYDTEFGGGRQ
ncbi:hypothetical protein BDA96_01G294000 [Sorghum bicolor]|uniref:C2H2-type domain-containing protein n=1 Tax=Sorghum bicolor TaxID=4558 RepID=A0A921UZU6_SORBI|nr:hypothetical protein BDA96_01G294000 [Sorghum bicolor]